ncbi:hypothetical protein APY04_2774 [Hyphomicrobium sulfonivorans]|uniref:Uncharacterized protein n=1 Tax=Hyphomicrobium sulfonivorans TaxID=121290 RepID=A0A109BB68_HYPSL|nr:hypothetical protein APY04_2774 [Hyphomicrobium sulfonivorans]
MRLPDLPGVVRRRRNAGASNRRGDWTKYLPLWLLIAD